MFDDISAAVLVGVCVLLGMIMRLRPKKQATIQRGPVQRFMSQPEKADMKRRLL